jgi:hypothetical protein
VNQDRRKAGLAIVSRLFVNVYVDYYRSWFEWLMARKHQGLPVSSLGRQFSGIFRIYVDTVPISRSAADEPVILEGLGIWADVRIRGIQKGFRAVCTLIQSLFDA